MHTQGLLWLFFNIKNKMEIDQRRMVYVIAIIATLLILTTKWGVTMVNRWMDK